MKVALDTNVFVYAEGLNDPSRKAATDVILARLDLRETVVSAQVLGELFSVQVRKFRTPPDIARSVVDRWARVCATVPTTPQTVWCAMQLCEDHRIGFWDSVVLASAAEAGCDALLSEDFQSGFTWRGVTVLNPFAPA